MNANYKAYADKHKRVKEFEGELVLVYLNKHRLPPSCIKLQHEKYGPFPILKKINNNSYLIDLPSYWNIASTFKVVDITS